MKVYRNTPIDESNAELARLVAGQSIGEYGRYGYEVQRNNLCAFVAIASRNKLHNYAAALAWSMAHPEMTA